MVHFHINLHEIAIFLAILLRLSIILFMLPIFNSHQVPLQVKALVILALTIFLHPLLRTTVSPLPFDLIPMALAAIGEIIFGMVFALCVQVIFSAFQTAGEFISFEMGFGFAHAVDPQGGAQVTIFAAWFELLAMLLLLSLNGHHIILRTIVESFNTIPVGGFTLDQPLLNKVLTMFGKLFVIALKIASPVLIALLLAQVGMGLMAKFAPQINILTTSFPLTILLGILFMSFSTYVWGGAIEVFFEDLFHFLRKLILMK